MTLEEIIALIPGARSAGLDRAIARCPAHDDSTASLSLRDEDGRILVHCFAGCSFEAISAALGLDRRDWFSDAEQSAGTRPAREFRRLAHEADVRRVEGYWRELDRLGTELRHRDMRRIAISRRVESGELSMESAMDLLASVYEGYSEIEARWQELMGRKEPRL